jgi:hypothetical protein
MQDLHLSIRSATHATLDVLPPSLTKLKLEGFGTADRSSEVDEADELFLEIALDTCPSFAMLTWLKHLDLRQAGNVYSIALDTAMLAGMTALQVCVVLVGWGCQPPNVSALSVS